MNLFAHTPSFPRGVHPSDGKEFSANAPIEALPTPKMVRIPLQQHLGAPAQATVKPRTEVVMGDPIGEAAGMISSPIHASLSGATAKVNPTPLPNGRRVDAIPIKVAEEQPLEGNELLSAMLGGEWPLEPPRDFKPEQVAEAAREAGIVGHGGAAFPSHVKLIRNHERPVDTILINGCECEPYLTADYRLMLESPGSVVAGAALARFATGARRVVICVEDHVPDAAAALRTIADRCDIEVLELQKKYPQGGEKSLALAVLGKTIPSGGLPLDIGAMILNVGTAAALARKVHRGFNLTHRVVCVTGRGITRPANLLVPLGTPIRELIDFCGGLRPDTQRMVAGGPMMGFGFSDTSMPITKGNGGLTFLTRADVEAQQETACLRCGRCVDVCPLNLVPSRMATATRSRNWELAEDYHIGACMECGSCAYACPAHLPLVQLIRVGKATLRSRS